MGLEGIGVWQLLVILAICVMIFGTKKLRNMGSDIGSAVKSFRSAMNDDQPNDRADSSTHEDPAAIGSDHSKPERNR